MSLLDPKTHFQAFRELISLLTRHRRLTWEMTKREIGERYVGQIFGAFWTIGHPLALMGIYVFFFAIVLKLKMSRQDLPLDYTVYLLSGLIPWLAFQESMAKGSTVILSNAGLVKQVVFPIEVLSVKGVFASLVTQIVATCVMMCYVLIKYKTLPWTYALVHGMMFFQALAMIGTSYFLGAIGVYFRDTKDFVQVFCTAGIYVIPIMYQPSSVPAAIRPILYFNPFSYVIWCYQDACYFGRFEHPLAWVVFPLGGLIVFYLGYRIFRKLRVAFGSAL